MNEGQEGESQLLFSAGGGGIRSFFERSKAPADIWVDYQNKLVEMGEQKGEETARSQNVAHPADAACVCCGTACRCSRVQP